MIDSERIFEPFKQGTNFFPHGYTWGGHPVSAAAAMAIRVLPVPISPLTTTEGSPWSTSKLTAAWMASRWARNGLRSAIKRMRADGPHAHP